jgi:SAM-dependent methyltransferase
MKNNNLENGPGGVLVDSMTFEERFPRVTKGQLSLASSIAKKIREVKTSLEAREKSDPQAIPSQVWESIKLFEYALYPTEEILNVWRMQVQAFTGNDLTYAAWSYPHLLSGKLLGQYKERTKGLPEEMIARPPRILGECGWEVNGGIINEDIVMYQKHLFAFYYSGLIGYLRSLEHPVILEIGSGYGALGYFIKKLVPNARYYMVDLVESLVFPAVYLQTAMPEYVNDHSVYDGKDHGSLASQGDAFSFVPASVARDLRNRVTFDFVINTGSFGEMAASQIKDYADLIADVLGPTGFLYEENQDTNVPVSSILKEKFVYQPLRGQQKIWVKDVRHLEALIPYVKEIDQREGSLASLNRRTLDRASRAVRKFPRLKGFVKKIVSF